MTSICDICNEEKEKNEIIILSCQHNFCWICAEDYLKNNLCIKPKCPIVSCSSIFKDSDMRMVLSHDDIERYEAICMNKLTHTHMCVLPECGSIVIYEDIDACFVCQICTVFNCIKCKLAHQGMFCNELISKSGESRDTVCQKEIARALVILKKIKAEQNRANVVELEANILAQNTAAFTCAICNTCICKGAGITLRQCFHNICRNCLMEQVNTCKTIPVPCPFFRCKSSLEDRECREILSDSDRNIYEKKSLEIACRHLQKAEHCRTPNCYYICDIDVEVEKWICENCFMINCVRCKAIHQNQTCEEYSSSKVISKDDLEIEKLIKEKKLMKCPNCKVIIEKRSGCNWIKCSSCYTELCWINQTYRWGPKGRGDTSAGCRCGVGGQMCHDDCGGCIPEDGGGQPECNIM